MKQACTIGRAQRYILIVGILFPYLARIPGALIKGLPWLTQFVSTSLGAYLFLGAFNAICWGSIILATTGYRHTRSVWFPVVFGFLVPAYGYGFLDLASSSTAAIALIFIPIYALPLVLVGWLAGLYYDRKIAPKSQPI